LLVTVALGSFLPTTTVTANAEDQSSASQVKFQYLSTFDKPCKEAAVVLAQNINKFPHPTKWTFVIACDEQMWDRLQQHMHFENPGRVMALTSLKLGITYVRGNDLVHPFDLSAAFQPEHFVGHELAHIYLNSEDEQRVDELAWKWQRDKATTLVVAK
jgi:hypothetical protein